MNLFQIYETDLETLERELPDIMSATLHSCNDPLMRKKWEAIKAVITNVRWNYGPPLMVKTEAATDEGEAWKS